MLRIRVVLPAIAAFAAVCLAMPAPALAVAQEPPDSTVDTLPAARALEALGKAWDAELDNLGASVRALAVDDGAYEFVARPNLPYVYERYPAKGLVAARIDTVLIVDRKGRPLFWRRVSDRQNRGFPDAVAFLAELPGLGVPGAPGQPSFAGAARLARGSSLVIAMPIYPSSRTGPARGWLIAGRTLDAAQWRRYATGPAADIQMLDPDSSDWPVQTADSPGIPRVPTLRVEPTGIRGWLPVYDLKGRRLRAFSITVAKPTAELRSVAPPNSLERPAAHWSVPLFASIVGAFMFIIRRRRVAVRFAPGVMRLPAMTPRLETAAAIPVPSPASAAPDAVWPGTKAGSVPAVPEWLRAPGLESGLDAADPASGPPWARVEQLPGDDQVAGVERVADAERVAGVVHMPAVEQATGVEQAPGVELAPGVAPAPAEHTLAPPDLAPSDGSPEWQRVRCERVAAATCGVLYQPQFDLHSDRIEGVEALLCIAEDGEHRPVTEVLTEAEADSLELEVTERWLDEACRDRKAWFDRVHREFAVTVPAPRTALEDPAFLPVLRRILEDCALAPRHLELAVTETAVTESAVARHALAQAGSMGVLICIDGFGKRTSSLHSLAVLPVAKLRIDAVLIREAARDPVAAACVQAIVGAARALHIAVGTTGVDSSGQLAALALHGRLLAQGAALAPPMESARLLATLRRGDDDTARLPVLVLDDPVMGAPELALAS